MQTDIEILIVEDSPTQAERLRQILETRGYRVNAAANGKQALGLLVERKPELVISDIVMPEMDGYTLCKQIKSDESTQDIPVILLTSLDRSEDVLEGLACGADNFITKPYKEDYLLTSIEQILANRRLRTTERVRIGVEIMFAGKRRFITADQQQMLTLLISTYEAAVLRNSELVQTQEELRQLNERLEELVEKRTAALSAEIAERKRAQEKEKQDEQFLNNLVGALDDVFYVFGPQGDFVRWNKALEQTSGYSQAEISRMKPADLFTKEGAVNIANAVQEAFEKGHVAVEEKLLTKDGRKIPMLFSGSVIEDSSHQPVLCGTGKNIAVLKQKEEQLRTSEARYRSYINVTGQIAWVTNAAGEIEEDVPSWRQFSGLTCEEVKGLGWTKALHPDDLERILQAWNKAVATKSTYEVEYRMRRHDGVYRDVLARGFPVCKEDGSIREWVGTCIDITERKQAEEERARLQEQLYLSQKMESVGRLAGGVAHDFNNILTGISGYTELVLERLDTASPMREDLAEVLRLAKRAAELTRQLLAFSRRQTLEPQVLNLNNLVAEATRMLTRVIGENIDLHFAPAPDLGNVRADPGQMEQILVNLAVNARDAMPAGGKLTIETRNVALDADYADHHVAVNPGSYVMLAVSDTGHGMDTATKARIFEPFFTTKEKGKGTGLGLATVYGIVKQHGGNIWVYSEPGKGAAFKVYLPRVEEVVGAAKIAAEPKAVRGDEAILVVEDEAPVRAIVERALTAQGYAVVTTSNAADAEILFLKQPERFALLLTDVVLPGINGRKLYERLKDRSSALKVLYMSGYTDNAIVHQGTLDTGVAFMQKPFTIETVARKVRQVLDS